MPQTPANPYKASIASLAENFKASQECLDPEVQAKRAAFLKAQLEQMTPAEEQRFEFFVRSHFSSRVVKKYLQEEINCAHKEKCQFEDSKIQRGDRYGISSSLALALSFCMSSFSDDSQPAS